MALAYAALLAFLPLAPVALIGELIPGADEVIYQILAVFLYPIIVLFG